MRRTLRQLALFAAAGLIGLGVDFSVLYALAPVLGWYFARIPSFVAAATATWLFNRHLTFAAAHEDSKFRQWLMYLLAMLGGAAVNYAIYIAVIHELTEVFGVLTPALGVALGSLGGMAVNFASARSIVFRKTHNE